MDNQKFKPDSQCEMVRVYDDGPERIMACGPYSLMEKVFSKAKEVEGTKVIIRRQGRLEDKRPCEVLHSGRFNENGLGGNMGWWDLKYWKSDGKALTQEEQDYIAAEIKKGFIGGGLIESANKKVPLSFPRPDEIQVLKANYQGRRIRLLEMPNDNDPIEPGTEGLVFDVDGAGHLMVNWDNGRGLNLIPGVDKFEIIGVINET